MLNCGNEVATKIHCAILLSQKTSQKFPTIGSDVSIKNAHKRGSTFVLCSESYLDSDIYATISLGEFVDFVKKHGLGASDIIKTDEIMKMLLNFTDMSDLLRQKLCLRIFTSMLELTSQVEKDQHQCLCTSVSHFNVISVNSCQSVDIKKSDKYKNFPYWSFGVQSKKNKNVLLFGHLQLQPVYGLLLIIDSQYNIPCIILNKSGKSITSLVNTYVLIKNYKICSEIFSENVPNLEYIMVELDDIIFIERNDSNIEEIMKPVIPVEQYKNVICFDLIKKSTVSQFFHLNCYRYLRYKKRKFTNFIFRPVLVIVTNQNVGYKFH